MKGTGRIGLVLRCSVSERNGTRLPVAWCQGGRSPARGRLPTPSDLQPSGAGGQARSLRLRGVTQVLLARREILREDSFGEELLGFLVRYGGHDHDAVATLGRKRER